MAKMVIIEHRDGRSFAVAPADFEKHADGDFQGFRITRYEDGSAYDGGPKTAAAVVKEQQAEDEKPKSKKD